LRTRVRHLRSKQRALMYLYSAASDLLTSLDYSTKDAHDVVRGFQGAELARRTHVGKAERTRRQAMAGGSDRLIAVVPYVNGVGGLGDGCAVQQSLAFIQWSLICCFAQERSPWRSARAGDG